MRTREQLAREQRDASVVATGSRSRRRLLLQTAGAERTILARSALPSSTTRVPDAAVIDRQVSRPPRVAFAFQGGGSLTAGQVGMVRALGEAGITADFVIGSSAGALNAVAYASGPNSGLDSLEALWKSLRRRHVAPISVRLVMRALAGRADGLVSAAALGAVIDAHLPSHLEDTCLPAHVVVTDLLSGAPVVLSRGAAGPALLASSAFPGLYAPVSIAGRRFVDGGVSADVPVLQAEDLGATVTYLLPAAVSDDETPARGPLAHAYRALGQIFDGVARGAVSAARGVVHVLPSPLSGASNPVDFHDTARLIDDGYRHTRRWLENNRDPWPSSVRESVPKTLTPSVVFPGR